MSAFHASYYSSLSLDEENCIITYDGTIDLAKGVWHSDTWFKPIAIQVEDFDAGGQVLSSMPIQFLAKVWISTEPNHCGNTPLFHTDTPAHGTVLDARTGVEIVIKAYSVGDEQYVKGFEFNSPLGMKCTDEIDGEYRVAT